MGSSLQHRIDTWKKQLLDLGKRNRLVNFKETKRSNVKITAPSIEDLYNSIVVSERSLYFPYAKRVQIDEDGEESYETITLGDIETNKQIGDLQKTLRSLRLKAKTSVEEQGINILYLTFGIIHWKENENSDLYLTSPLVLVPVSVTITSATSPYALSIHNDEIVVNPSLTHKFEADFGLMFPEFDSTKDGIMDYLQRLEELVANKGWKVTEDTHLTTLSFLKINMYKDLEKHEDKLNQNKVVSAIAGESEVMSISEELNNYDHDNKIKPINTYQVVDADSSQQDAILLSKTGMSFVLQGPPGTGKSQTITNIISEALADGKKILFVSEKMAALQVVYTRLAAVGLSDFCFALHSHKAKKKDILRDLSNSITIDRKRVRDDILIHLDTLEKKRISLNEYQNELHTVCSGLNCRIYDVNGKLAKLSFISDVIFFISDVSQVTQSELTDRCYLLTELSKTIGKRSEDYTQNVWRNSSVEVLNNELRHDIDSNFTLLVQKLGEVSSVLDTCYTKLGILNNQSLDNISCFIEILDIAGNSPILPIKWIYEDNIYGLQQEANVYLNQEKNIETLRGEILAKYTSDALSIDGIDRNSRLNELSARLLGVSRIGDQIEIAKVKSLLDSTKSLHIEFNHVYSSAKQLAIQFGVTEPTTLGDIDFIISLSSALSIDMRPTKSWFSNKSLCDIVLEHQATHNEYKILKSEILSKFNEGVFSSSLLESLQNSLKNITVSNSVLHKRLDENTYGSLRSVIENRTAITSISNESLSYLISLIEKATRVADLLNASIPNSFNSIETLVRLCKGLLVDCNPTSVWFESDKVELYREKINQMASITTDISVLKQNIKSNYDKEVLSLDVVGMLKRFRSQYNSFFRFLNKNYRSDIANIRQFTINPSSIDYKSAFKLLNQLKEIKDKEDEIINEEDQLTTLLGDRYCGVSTDWNKIASDYNVFRTFVEEFADVIASSSKLKKALLHKSAPVQDITSLLEEYSEDTISNIQDKLRALTSKESTHVPNVIKIFEDVAVNINVINSEYESILSQLSSYRIAGDSDSAQYTIGLIDNLGKVSKVTKDIAANKDQYSIYYGSYYNSIDTDWLALRADIERINSIVNLFPSSKIACKLKELLLSNEIPHSDCLELAKFTNCNQFIECLNQLFIAEYETISSIEYICNTLQVTEASASDIVAIFNEFSTVRNTQGSYGEVFTDVGTLANMQSLISDLASKEEELQMKFDLYFSNNNTNWDKVIYALLYAEKTKVLIEKYHLSRSFVERICRDKQVIDECKEFAQELTELQGELTQYKDWIFNLFEKSENLGAYHIKDLASKLTICRDNKHLLEEWVDYRSNRRRCKEAGLSEYIAQIEAHNISADLIVDAYLKRFYRLWLDAILPLFPHVQSFRGRIQNQTVSDFKELDRSQFRIAQSRVRERVISRIPDFNSITSTKDEVGILRRELNKQRKLMPLRKLFMVIPNLITSLRPCFMMSPLSVSLFLEADSYEFDMVIFDEASQVHTEDAIGAIMRGKQVIIVGDTKQLPPTNFFANSVGDGGYDNDDEQEDDDAGAYQSILDESVVVLPERSLRWHYRSRHEDLITFSNVKIYNNSLITFPSSVEKASDCGVEYIHVSDGVYDRGKKRSNMIEAKRVASLVFEHYRKHPNRSLGVVTFSEAQMQAVDAAIRHLLQSKPSYDKYFTEDMDEPFFIKNIENVQGDERDTIIFSIGYARDANGTISMNFGALNKDGGHRRLNVAITRAKHNVKLVGSIVPTDIDLSKTSAEGVRLLRSYIEFAQQGVMALQKELTYCEALDFDSPFEEAVYDFLTSKGYEVTTQVGCSGFRIDMAVKHPQKSGVFAIGVECDGATYHSSRTARERDRLRQDVLEGMGWTIYRIWSTDWIKDQKSEESKLVVAVEKALGNTPLDTLFGDVDIETTQIDISEIEENIEYNEASDNVGYRFISYVQANLADMNNSGSSEIVKKIIEIEQPIHFEELCRRAAPIYGNQKATIKIRTEMYSQFKYYLANDIEQKGDFITLKGFNTLQVRVPDPTDSFIRNIAHISPDELALAMKLIASHSFGITSEDLFVVTARELGYKRTSENISTILRNVYAQMFADGVIREVDGKVNIN